MKNFIPIYKYAKLKSVSIQTVYRWIRERKLNQEDIKIEEVVVKRMRIEENAMPQGIVIKSQDIEK